MIMPVKKEQYHVFLVKPSKYDENGYTITWGKGVITSNALACINALAEDVRNRQCLGPNVDMVVHRYDETVEQIPVRKMCHLVKKSGSRGIVCFVGVQTNQFARAVDLAREFRAGGLPAMIGGFHASGCIEMLPELPPEIKAAVDEGITMVAGEVELRFEEILKAAYENRLEPIYRFVDDKPALDNKPVPYLPNSSLEHFVTLYASVDAGRGCPFHCSFCTIINIQGNTMRGRNADDFEKLLRISHAQGVHHIFITDDNFARHKEWEAIIDRVIELREKEGLRFVLQIQSDTVAHKIPNFIEKVTRAGCRRVFLGLESVNPENLRATGKYQNQLKEYRVMLQKWREHGALTYAGYIIGFPGDTYESIMRDVEYLKREIPLDFAEFFIMTPLPGSKDHQKNYLAKVPMEPDTNLYDTEHVCVKHPKMSKDELMRAYQDAWKSFYSPAHMLTLMKRWKNSRGRRRLVMWSLVWFCNAIFIEKVHPLMGGFLRIKGRKRRRPSLKRESIFVYYPRRAFELLKSSFQILGLILHVVWLWRRASNVSNANYSDVAIEPAKKEETPKPVVSTIATT